MRNLFLVFKFEFARIINKKAFKITTSIFVVLAILLLSLPTILGAINSDLFNQEARDAKKIKERLKDKFVIVINDDRVDAEDLEEKMHPSNLIFLKDKDKIDDLITSKKIKAAFVINSTNDYEYIVNNTSMVSQDEVILKDALTKIHRNTMLDEKDINPKHVNEIYDVDINSKTTILGKDGSKNFLATQLLTFGLYFLVFIYGQNTAVSVASEKSNRSMEILVTSTSTESLIFGKVIANALAGIVQFGTIIIIALATYRLNIKAWKDLLGVVFDVPVSLLINFFIFGTLGYLLYLFIYSAIGALVSRTEDISTSATPITFVYMLAFFSAVIGINFPDNIVIKIASYFPFTSFMAMFVRMSMGSVSTGGVLISLAILAGTTILVGIISAKIYRLGTLMYGNPIKIREAFKLLKDE